MGRKQTDGKLKPDLEKYDTVAPNSSNRYSNEESKFYTVDTPPYYVEASDEWRMVLVYVTHSGKCRVEVPCESYHLVGAKKAPKTSNLTKEQKEKYMKISKAAITTGAVLLIALMVFGWIAGNYNSLVVARSSVDNSWAKVETQYQRRLDLIDNVVSSVKGSQGQEQKVFGQIADARKQYSNASTTDEKAAAASQVETTIAMLPKLQEQYPELKSNEQVSKLIAELQGTENGIAAKRDTYNDTVTNYNNNISQFPKVMFAGLFHFEKAKLFKADVAASKAPKVDFK